MKSLLLIIVATVCFGSLAYAGSTARSRYVRRVTKIAPPPSAKPKGLCVCQNGLDQGQVGYFRQAPGPFNALIVTCHVPGFDQAGDVIGGTSCDTFIPLTK